ncbi:hypothetical protein RJ639_040167 [Escallonia herrerae]|uniref:Pentatricopeptide repeat-containing protein n=1 Tax=Escallonia herrerae TaxID=1293975 RepID=A0AA88WII3_9ASTE|nr:hypothetical protein RJ639_040167 [Escallonia herrerae]
MGALESAKLVFNTFPKPDSFMWGVLIKCCVWNRFFREAISLYDNMLYKLTHISSFLFPSVLRACCGFGDLGIGQKRQAKSIHGFVVSRDIQGNGSLDNSLVAMYGKCGDLYSAERLFDNVVDGCTPSWTAMITCYNNNGCYREALDIFVEMHESNAEPNALTMMGVLCSCARLGWLKEGKSVHGYAREGMSEEALLLFVQMQRQLLLPDSFTLASALSACGNIGFFHFRCQIHGYVIKSGSSSEFVQNSLIDMYSKCGFVDGSYKIFENSQQKSVIMRNSMMCGFSQNGSSAKALNLFDQMYSDRLEMDEVTFLSAIQACSNLGYLEKGKWIHHKLITMGVAKDTHIDTALSDMYAKCGDLQMAQGVFDSMSKRSVVSWSVMVGGYGMHGQIDAAISLFNRMLEVGTRPNDITFMNILSACSHAGHVEEGKLHFNSMRDFGIEPKFEHFACLVDLLSRAGDLDGAYSIIKSMPFAADASIWGALLNGCRIHRRMDMLSNIQQNLIKTNMDDTGYYTLLSNIFTEGGEWDEFRMVRDH